MRVIIFGATGMVGKGVLLECLDDARIERVLLVSRHPIDVSHPKLREIVPQDFFDDIQPLKGIRSKTRWYQALYGVMGPFYPLFRRLLPRYVTTTVNIGRA